MQQQCVRNDPQKFSLAAHRMMLKQRSVLEPTQRGTNPQCPSALLGQSYKEDALHPTSSLWGFDFLGLHGISSELIPCHSLSTRGIAVYRATVWKGPAFTLHTLVLKDVAMQHPKHQITSFFLRKTSKTIKCTENLPHGSEMFQTGSHQPPAVRDLARCYQNIWKQELRVIKRVPVCTRRGRTDMRGFQIQRTAKDQTEGFMRGPGFIAAGVSVKADMATKRGNNLLFGSTTELRFTSPGSNTANINTANLHNAKMAITLALYGNTSSTAIAIKRPQDMSTQQRSAEEHSAGKEHNGEQRCPSRRHGGHCRSGRKARQYYYNNTTVKEHQKAFRKEIRFQWKLSWAITAHLPNIKIIHLKNLSTFLKQML
ncbi:hypothetical protein EK904_013856 [Melospiza melodia maxima]|nr:hypothetical protein EK904_013856 [Melospiza melodia maxima]